MRRAPSVLRTIRLLMVIAMLGICTAIMGYCCDWMDREQERRAGEHERDKLLIAVDEFLARQRAG